jgi:hypothetical protein
MLQARRVMRPGGLLAVTAPSRRDSPFPRPGSEPAEVGRYFTFGGPVYGVGFGLLTGALSLAGLRTGELPRPVAVAGLASAASGLLSPLSFLDERAGGFIPLGRFSELVVSGIAGVRLGHR